MAATAENISNIMRARRQQKFLEGNGGKALRARLALRRAVVRAAAGQLPQLPPLERAAVLEGLALLLSNRAERELARYTAGLLRQSEEHQVKLYERLTGGNP